jgi:hypothetical protein
MTNYPAKCESACVNKMRAMSSSVHGFKSVYYLIAIITHAKISSK